MKIIKTETYTETTYHVTTEAKGVEVTFSVLVSDYLNGDKPSGWVTLKRLDTNKVNLTKGQKDKLREEIMNKIKEL